MVYSVATAAHGLSSFSSYQCAAAAKAAVSSAAMAIHVVALTHAVAVVITTAVASKKQRSSLGGAFFLHKQPIKVKNKTNENSSGEINEQKSLQLKVPCRDF